MAALGSRMLYNPLYSPAYGLPLSDPSPDLLSDPSSHVEGEHSGRRLLELYSGFTTNNPDNPDNPDKMTQPWIKRGLLTLNNPNNLSNPGSSQSHQGISEGSENNDQLEQGIGELNENSLIFLRANMASVSSSNIPNNPDDSDTGVLNSFPANLISPCASAGSCVSQLAPASLNMLTSRWDISGLSGLYLRIVTWLL